MTRDLRVFALVLAAGIATACGDINSAVTPSATAAGTSSTAGSTDPQVNGWLAEARAATAKYHDLEAALADGFVQFSPCVERPGVGGMGFHYGHPGRIDATLNHREPEILVYQPQAGRLKLGAVEYIVPLPLAAQAPVLFNRPLHASAAINSWEVHAWIWKPNPAGIFEDWNPNVSCSN